MELSLMEATAWTLALVGIVAYFRYGEPDKQWGRILGASMTVVAMIQLMVFAGVLSVGFLSGNLVLPVLLMFIAVVFFFAVEGKSYSGLALYVSLLQFLVHFEVVTSVG